MSKNKEHPARGRQDKVDLSEGQRGKGVQVIQTAGLPQGVHTAVRVIGATDAVGGRCDRRAGSGGTNEGQ